MPDPVSLSRVECVVQSACEPNVRRYLDEAYKCFRAEAYNAAVVMAWCGVIAYFRLLVSQIGVPFLAYHYWALKRKNDHESEHGSFDQWQVDFNLKEVPDRNLLEALQRMHLVEVSNLAVLRQRRNSFAHPDNEFASEQEAVGLIETANVVCHRTVSRERISHLADVVGYAKATSDKLAAQRIGWWIEDTSCLELAHGVLTAYLYDEEANVAGLLGLWYGLWWRLTEQQTASLWDRLECAVEDAVGNLSILRSLYDLTDLVIWPRPDTENKSRDRIAEIYIAWLENRVSTNEFGGPDIDLARRLRQHLPCNIRQKLQIIVEDMKRRL